jgi:novobiocin biosynthesis protein NovU/D-mycarose 3-C-methyltransferase
MSTSESVREVTDCRVCGSTDWQPVADFGPMTLPGHFLQPGGDHADEPRFPLGVISCRSCRLMTLTHTVSPEVLYREYIYLSSDSDTITQHMRHVVQTFQDRFDVPAGSFVVELGSNTGTQLEVFRDAGMRVLGVDPARNIAAMANERGVETLPEFFNHTSAQMVAEKYGKAQIMLGRHCFAHINDLASVAAGVGALLDTAGVFAVEVPYILTMLERNEFDTIYHEHLSYFSVSTLSTLFERHGMRVVDVERLPQVHGGSMLVFVGLEDGPWAVRPVVKELLQLEQEFGLFDDETYRDFGEGIERTTQRLTSLVRGLVAKGKKVAAYGAPAKGTTMLNACGLNADDVVYASDTTPLKQGKLLPGSHIPVYSPEYAKENPPDYFLMLAWNYSEEIIRKERAFLENGGRFIVPIPYPSIVSADS